MLSCKHLCCREGVDKAPKGLNKHFVSAASMVNMSSIATKSASDVTLPITKKDAKAKSSHIGNVGEIVAVDLTDQGVDHAGRKIREPTNLNKLHESITEFSPAPEIPQRRPTTNLRHWDQSKISLLSKATATRSTSDYPPTDYNDDRMGGLPDDDDLISDSHLSDSRIDGLPHNSDGTGGLTSTSVLSIAQESNQKASYQDRLTDYGSDWQDDLPSLSALLDNKVPMDDDVHETDPLEDYDLLQSNNNRAELEDAMIGSSESVARQEYSQVHDATSSTKLQHNDTGPILFNRPIDATATAERSDISEVSFLSIDSPEKTTRPPQKRTSSLALGAEEAAVSNPAKRSKISKDGDRALRASSNAENQEKPAVPVIKPGQPAWVYDFDPSFIAEYQDFVEFV